MNPQSSIKGNNTLTDYSVVVPVFNEEENLEKLVLSLIEQLECLGKSFELVFVDDASTDRSFSVLTSIGKKDPRIKALRFRCNRGQTAALMAGIKASKGEIIITMDADLQNDPKDIPEMVKTLDQGYDFVSGWRRERKDNYLTRVLPSQMANWVISKISGVPLHDYGCTLKAYRGSMLRNLKLYGEMHRFIPIYMVWEGARYTEIPVEHHPRTKGVSKYGLSRIFKVLLDLVTINFLGSYSTKPIYVFGGAGLLCFLGCISTFVMVLWEKFVRGVWVHRNPVFNIGILLWTISFQFLGMGILAEMMVRTYHEATGKDTYSILEKHNL